MKNEAAKNTEVSQALKNLTTLRKILANGCKKNASKIIGWYNFPCIITTCLSMEIPFAILSFQSTLECRSRIDTGPF